MLSKIAQFFRSNHPALLLMLISFILCFQNYDKGTFLTGWDTLHPEFNFGIYWNRIIGGVWQEHQSLGAVASQAHASEIPHVIILMILDLFAPMSMLRYLYAFLMILIGPLGVYVFLKLVLTKFVTSGQSKIGAFAGGLFYLLNLGTLQHFYVPLEMFLTHYGFLGWVFWSTVLYLDEPRRRHLGILFFVAFFTSSQAHTPTLFYAFMINYGGFLALFVLSKWLLEKKFVQYFVRAAVVFALTLFVNFYWFLPNLYFAVNHGDEIQDSKIHQLFSQEAFLQNKEYGNVRDTILIKNFLFNWGEHVGKAQFGELLDEWGNFHASSLAIPLGYLFFGFIVLGVLIGTFKRPEYFGSVFGVFAISIFFLFNQNPPFGFIFRFLQDNVPLFKEAFRFPFTKFSITLMFSYAVFFGVFWSALLSNVDRVWQYIRLRYLRSFIYFVSYALVVAGLIYYMWPAFQGYFISPSMRVKIPDRYFEMFSYFDQQTEFGRVMNLPIHSFWGWVYHNWDNRTELGYQGAGFLWFGIKQPLINREFDRWNILNEQVYRDLSLAVYSQDTEEFLKALDKYQIRWIIVDKSVLAVGQDSKVLFYPEIDKLLGNDARINIEKDFGEGLRVYRYTPNKDFARFIQVDSYSQTSHQILKEYYDPAFSGANYYISSDKSAYPYLGITDSFEYLKSQIVSRTGNDLWLSSSLGNNLKTEPGLSDHLQFEVLGAIGEGETISLQFNPVISFEKYSGFKLNLPKSFTESVSYLRVGKSLIKIDPAILDQLTYNYLGLVFFDPKVEQALDLYKKSDLESLVNPALGELEPCSAPSYDSSYSSFKTPDGIGLTARNVNSCLTIPLNKLLPANSINKTQNVYIVTLDNSIDKTYSDICVLSSKTGLCINSNVSDTTSYFVANEEELHSLFLRFYAKGSGKTDDIEVVFANPRIQLFSSVYTAEVSDPDISIVRNDPGIKIKNDPSLGGGYVSKIINNPRLCSSPDQDLPQGSLVKGENSLTYTSKGNNGVCDSFRFNNLAHENGYLLEVRARNLGGVPLRLCLTNEFSKRCDLYTSVGTSSDMTSYYFVIMPIGQNSGYTLNVSNLSFGSDESRNELEYVNFYPLSINLIRSLHTLDYQPIASNQKLVVFNQAYEPGWVALCGMWFCNAQHVMVNNWANGWVFDKSVDFQTIQPIFWPEILEIFGLVINLIILVYLIYAALTSSKRP